MSEHETLGRLLPATVAAVETAKYLWVMWRGRPMNSADEGKMAAMVERNSQGPEELKFDIVDMLSKVQEAMRKKRSYSHPQSKLVYLDSYLHTVMNQVSKGQFDADPSALQVLHWHVMELWDEGKGDLSEKHLSNFAATVAAWQGVREGLPSRQATWGRDPNHSIQGLQAEMDELEQRLGREAEDIAKRSDMKRLGVSAEDSQDIQTHMAAALAFERKFWQGVEQQEMQDRLTQGGSLEEFLAAEGISPEEFYEMVLSLAETGAEQDAFVEMCRARGVSEAVIQEALTAYQGAQTMEISERFPSGAGDPEPERIQPNEHQAVVPRLRPDLTYRELYETIRNVQQHTDGLQRNLRDLLDLPEGQLPQRDQPEWWLMEHHTLLEQIQTLKKELAEYAREMHRREWYQERRRLPWPNQPWDFPGNLSSELTEEQRRILRDLPGYKEIRPEPPFLPFPGAPVTPGDGVLRHPAAPDAGKPQRPGRPADPRKPGDNILKNPGIPPALAVLLGGTAIILAIIYIKRRRDESRLAPAPVRKH